MVGNFTMMNNLKELKTTITGAVLILFTVMYFVLPYFSEKELWEIDNMYVGVGLGVGVGLILAPDRLVDFIFGWLKKKN